MSRGRKLAIAAVGLLLAIQLVPVPRDNPPVVAAVEAPAEVQRVLSRSCYDCHSHETRWPWYSRVAPASWLVARHVAKGRDELNFSAWGEYSDRRRAHKLEEIEELVADRKMPLRTYLPLHPEASLSAEDAELLIGWSRAERAAHVGEETAGDGR